METPADRADHRRYFIFFCVNQRNLREALPHDFMRSRLPDF